MRLFDAVLLIVNLATAEEVDDEYEGEHDEDEEENDDVDVSSIIKKIVWCHLKIFCYL